MKTLRQVCAVTILTMALAVSVFAGQIECPGVASSPPQGINGTTISTPFVVLIVVDAIN